jgi:hypothetical protein
MDINYEIVKPYAISEITEFSVEWNGWSFLVISGRHINGWFIAVPNLGVCVEASSPDDIYYNTEKLAKVIDRENVPSIIANAVNEYWSTE